MKNVWSNYDIFFNRYGFKYFSGMFMEWKF